MQHAKCISQIFENNSTAKIEKTMGMNISGTWLFLVKIHWLTS